MSGNLKQTKLSHFFKPVNALKDKVETNSRVLHSKSRFSSVAKEHQIEIDFESTQESEITSSQDERSVFAIDEDLLSKIRQLSVKFKPFSEKLDTYKPGIIRLSGDSISTLLASAFLNQIKKSTLKINFNQIQDQPTKLHFFMNYFKQINSCTNQVEFERVVIQDFPDWSREMDPLVDLETTTTRMENVEGSLVDFANKRIGGGVLSRGAVQEEIMFMCRPECIAARYFTEPLEENEALVIRNATVFSDYEGYARSLKFKEYQNDCFVSDIIAIDALRFEKKNSLLELKKDTITREINKAYVGFSQVKDRIVTGNWGCGAFNGNQELKFLIQMIAASSFLDLDLARRVEQLASKFIPFNAKLEQNKAGSIRLDSGSIASLLAAAFLDQIKDSTLELDFTLFKEFPIQMKFIACYFNNIVPGRQIEFERIVLNEYPQWESEEIELIAVTTTTNRMESIQGTLVDFANCFIGGGVLEGGCVQEEIMFMCRPECIAARYFTQPLLDNEALVIRNAKVYSDYEGYGFMLEYKDYNNECFECDIIAIDAVCYNWRNSTLEFNQKSILREINKAYTGFQSSKAKIVTGNWG
ncbi:hypothetical protein HDV06_001700, partial [Boothiomyces sp. JEL0866]